MPTFQAAKLISPAVLAAILMVSCTHKGENVHASGVFESREIILSSQSTGEILNFDANEGDMVLAGQVLGSIDSVQLELKKDMLHKNIEIAETRRPDIEVQLAPLLQQIESADRERERVKNLLKIGATNEKQYDDIMAQIRLMEKQLDAQRSSLQNSNLLVNGEIESLELQLEQLGDQIRRCTVLSPISGTILAKYIEMGEFASPGKALVKMADMKEMILRAYITSDQLTTMKLGDEVEVSADFKKDDNRFYKGTIIWISDKAEFTPKTIQTRDERSHLVYAVKVSVPNDGFLKIGIYGSIILNNDEQCHSGKKSLPELW